MAFPQHRRQRRYQASSRKIGERRVHVDPSNYTVPRALTLPVGGIINHGHDITTSFSSHPAAETVAKGKQPTYSRRKREMLLPLGGFSFERASTAAAVGPAAEVGKVVPASPSLLDGRGQGGGREKGWKEGILGYGARVLALSVSSPKRELLCDRKDPYAHLSPRRLAFTVVKSGFVVAAPMLNEVILENLDEDDNQSGGGRGSFGGGRVGGDPFGTNIRRVYVGQDGELVFERAGDEEKREEGDRADGDVAASLSKSFELFPALTFRRVLHSVMTVSTQRLLEWQAVLRLPARTADRLTKNVALSALRKTERMSRSMAAARMTLTAARSLFFQNLALFIVDELFLGVRIGLTERRRRRDNPYACTDWPAVLRELRKKSVGNAAFAFCIWVAGTIGSVVGTMVYPPRGPELLSILAEMGASAVLG
ncbi:expressed unknown protein [Ectocarpus siliculosus]|uniref:Uncharacterized protein n=1 Tax=Ectocarpus siliculosus TaxID=2880 RepID=D7G1N2_ECTSI|nr:expressed unknown protein [Ectocarpus siliculosus]|eukprot:CBJ33277.1 expressed unknown protein [Ectocarpus siliculosus]